MAWDDEARPLKKIQIMFASPYRNGVVNENIIIKQSPICSVEY